MRPPAKPLSMDETKGASVYSEMAESQGLTQQSFGSRKKQLLTIDGREVVNFTNCSYLGLDTDPEMINSAKRSLDQYGLHFCCARTRLSTDELLIWSLISRYCLGQML